MPFCSQFIPMEVVTHPKHQSIIYHPSILPLHRGASAINWFVHYQLLRFLSASSQAFHSRFRVLNFQVYRIDLIVFSVLILSSDQITLWEFYITAFSLSHFQKPANQLRCCCHLWLDRIRSGWRIVTFKTCRRINSCQPCKSRRTNKKHKRRHVSYLARLYIQWCTLYIVYFPKRWWIVWFLKTCEIHLKGAS